MNRVWGLAVPWQPQNMLRLLRGWVVARAAPERGLFGCGGSPILGVEGGVSGYCPRRNYYPLARNQYINWVCYSPGLF